MAFKLEIYTPYEKFFEGNVNSISLNTLSGSLQILPRHIQTVVGIKPCIMKINTEDETLKVKVSEGILEFQKNNCKIFVSFAQKVED
ncbi:ATP synthase, Delta/Epsilon chain, beta-sandwich domain [Caloramator fervidus]|uniref:ATP synthase, Delta/Epsilon chain, beta-sandwich domain n=1 Tax=Caloramator fervidus TaxID=29344 RepID=A0A1H5RL69_9CLOT|nr:F0F1 ATP synthase subunit epsilon [Caloramator fervidus]SEF39103.1 ATP synthase, Delta/Epsilon chain, beta-sandwich domain [Caloramator fervidus]